MRITFEEIPDPGEGGRVLYRHYYRDGKSLGAVSEKPEGFRALAYRRDGDNSWTELGMHETRELAEKALTTWAEQNPPICTCNPGGAWTGMHHSLPHRRYCELTGTVGA